VTATGGRLIGGELNCAIANAVVSVHSRRLGRGPTGAQAFYRSNVVVVMMSDNLTQAERSLAEVGDGDTVRRVREDCRDAMRGELVGAVEDLTGRHVLAFLSDQSVTPDVATEVFVLDEPL
jgi:uncharacterized protein YbcI